MPIFVQWLEGMYQGILHCCKQNFHVFFIGVSPHHRSYDVKFCNNVNML